MFFRFSFFTLLIAILFFSSCKKEYSREGGSFRNCVSCEYLPVCDSSVFVYVDSVDGRIDTLENTMQIFGDTTIAGKKFTSVSGFATFNTGLYANCDGGDYRLLFPLSALGIDVDSIVNDLLQTIQLPIPLPPGLINIPTTVQTSVLKTAVPVGGMWTDTIYNLSLPPFLSLLFGLEYTMIEKNVSRSVFQKTYSNVMHVRSELKLVSTLITLPLDFTIDYYFARDTGIIEVQVSSAGVVERSLRLWSYRI